MGKHARTVHMQRLASIVNIAKSVCADVHVHSHLNLCVSVMEGSVRAHTVYAALLEDRFCVLCNAADER